MLFLKELYRITLISAAAELFDAKELGTQASQQKNSTAELLEDLIKNKLI